MIARTLDNAAALVDGIRAGSAAANPARTKKSNPCSFCDFRSACLMDDTLDASRVRRFEEMSNDEVIARLRAEQDEDK